MWSRMASLRRVFTGSTCLSSHVVQLQYVYRKEGRFSLVILPGEYYVLAFKDRKGNI